MKTESRSLHLPSQQQRKGVLVSERRGQEILVLDLGLGIEMQLETEIVKTNHILL